MSIKLIRDYEGKFLSFQLFIVFTKPKNDDFTGSRRSSKLKLINSKVLFANL